MTEPLEPKSSRPSAAARGERPGVIEAPWAWLMHRARSWLVLCRVQVRELTTEPVDVARTDGIAIRVADHDDLEHARVEWPDQLDPAFVDPALARGDICLAAFAGGRMVAFVWRSFGTAPHADDVWVEIKPPYWYTYKMYTHRDFRGGHLAGLLAQFGDRFCQDGGYVRGIGFIETHNYRSIRANLRVGSRLVGFAGYLKLFGKAYPFRSPGAAAHSFRFYRHPD
jgi:hypothetical protein